MSMRREHGRSPPFQRSERLNQRSLKDRARRSSLALVLDCRFSSQAILKTPLSAMLLATGVELHCPCPELASKWPF